VSGKQQGSFVESGTLKKGPAHGAGPFFANLILGSAAIQRRENQLIALVVVQRSLAFTTAASS
jgi:hypothetical protein